MSLVVSSLESKKNLRQLIVPYIATDQLLAFLGKFCPVVELLDISGAEMVTEKGVESLYRHRIGWDTCPTDLTSTLR